MNCSDSFDHRRLHDRFLLECMTDGSQEDAMKAIIEIVEENECVLKNSSNFRGQTALILSVIYQNHEIMDFLLSKNVDLNAFDDLHMNAMDYAIRVHNSRAQLKLKTLKLEPREPFKQKTSLKKILEEIETCRSLRESVLWQADFNVHTGDDIHELCRMFMKLKNIAADIKTCCEQYDSDEYVGELKDQAEMIADRLCEIRKNVRGKFLDEHEGPESCYVIRDNNEYYPPRKDGNGLL